MQPIPTTYVIIDFMHKRCQINIPVKRPVSTLPQQIVLVPLRQKRVMVEPEARKRMGEAIS